MHRTPLVIPEVLLLTATRFEDERGHFSELYNRRTFEQIGITGKFVQDNYSLSRETGTIRGLHFQLPPAAQAKLVRVGRGSILDVVVDIRHGSPTFGQHVTCKLSADACNQLFVPVGFAHGFCTLDPDTEVFYKVSDYYSPHHDRGLLWHDSVLAIDWPVTRDQAVVSEKDSDHPRLIDLAVAFEYQPPDATRRPE